MRYARVKTANGPRIAAEHENVWRELDVDHADFVQVLRDGADALPTVRDGAAEITDPEFLAPLRPGKIIAIGLNYLDHVRESGVEPPPSPLVFSKFPSTVVGPDDAIELNPAVSERVDWEGELAVVIGKPLSKATQEEAMDAVFGYTVSNDVSGRDVQFADGQWIRGKNLDTFCPLGPVIVSADQVGDPQALQITTRVNGETVQDASTSLMLFGVAELLSFCSQSFAFEPGDVVLSGTPWGCGEFMTPRRSLAHGDTVEITIDGVGVLSNPVVDPSR